MPNEIRQYGLKTTHEPVRDIPPVIVRKDRELELVYLAHNAEAGNPLEEDDGLGNIYTRARSASAEERSRFLQALGLDEDGDPSDDRKPNPNAVILDCYRHGGEIWSISSEGTQCQWDTSRRVGVWVPSSCLIDEIERRRKPYSFGTVVQRQDEKWIAEATNRGESSPEFDTWGNAFEWLRETVKKSLLAFPTRIEAELGRQRACMELARQALDEFNGWLAGDCYLIVRESHVWRHRWKRTESEIEGNCTGQDYAIKELEDFRRSLCIGRAA